MVRASCFACLPNVKGIHISAPVREKWVPSRKGIGGDVAFAATRRLLVGGVVRLDRVMVPLPLRVAPSLPPSKLSGHKFRPSTIPETQVTASRNRFS